MVGTNVNVIGAGRTDTGVHAFYQIAHVDLEKDWIPAKLEGALNFFLKKIFRDEFFDACISTDTFEHVPPGDLFNILIEMKRVLKTIFPLFFSFHF